LVVRARRDLVIKLYASSARSPPSAARMTLPCKNCASRLFTLPMKRLRISPDPLRLASSSSVWFMESIGAIHCGARPEVRVRVTVPIGAAWAPRVDGENFARRPSSLSWRALHQGLARLHLADMVSAPEILFLTVW